MISLFHALMYVINEISAPVWQNEVRQIARQIVEAMREAEKKKTVSLGKLTSLNIGLV